MNFEDEVKAFCIQLEEFVRSKMQSEGVDENNWSELMERLITECLATFWPEYMHAPIREALKSLKISYQTYKSQANALYETFLRELVFNARIKQESCILKRIEAANMELSNMAGYMLSRHLCAGVVSFAASQIVDPVRRVIFQSVGNALYRNDSGLSLSAIDQCYADIIIDTERLHAAQDEMDRRKRTFREANDPIPILIMKEDFRTKASTDYSVGDDSYDFYAAFLTPTKEDPIVLSRKSQKLIQKIIYSTLMSTSLDDVIVSNLVQACVEITPSTILTADYSAHNYLVDVFYALIPGRGYNAADLHGNLRHLIYVKKRFELEEMIRNIITEHRGRTTRSLNTGYQWANMSILLALEDIVNEIYGDNTLARFVLPNFLAKLLNNTNVFELSAEYLADFFWQFVPAHDVRCSDEGIIRSFRELVAHEDEFKPEPECGVMNCQNCEGCNTPDAPGSGDKDKDVEEEKLADADDDLPPLKSQLDLVRVDREFVRWEHPALKVVPTVNLRDAIAPTLQAEDFIMSVMSTERSGYKGCGPFPSHRSVGFYIKDLQHNIEIVYGYPKVRGNVEIACQHIVDLFYPVIKVMEVGSAFSGKDLFLALGATKGYHLEDFSNAIFKRIPFYHELSSEDTLTNCFVISKVHLTKAAWNIFIHAKAILEEDSDHIVFASHPRGISVIAREIFAECFNGDDFTEQETTVFIENIRTTLKTHGIRDAKSSKELQMVFIKTILQYLPIDPAACIE